MVNLIKIQFSDIIPATLEPTHGFFIINAPPYQNEWGNVNKSKPGDAFNPCWGFCRNGVPIDLPVIDDYFGFALVDDDSKTLLKGYYIEPLVPAYTYVPFYFKQDDVIMPNRDLHLTLFVGYFTPSTTPILFHTDYRKFTIKAGTAFPIWLLFLAIPLLFLKRKI